MSSFFTLSFLSFLSFDGLYASRILAISVSSLSLDPNLSPNLTPPIDYIREPIARVTQYTPTHLKKLFHEEGRGKYSKSTDRSLSRRRPAISIFLSVVLFSFSVPHLWDPSCLFSTLVLLILPYSSLHPSFLPFIFPSPLPIFSSSHVSVWGCVGFLLPSMSHSV